MRYRLYFNVKPGEIIYETPVLDDVTLTFNTGGIQFLYYDTNYAG